MKKIVLALVCCVAAMTASAQVWVGSGLGFGYQKIKDGEKTTDFYITPEVGYQLSENFAVAAEFQYSFNKVEKAKATTFAVGPYVRYTFYKNDNLSLFGEVAGHYVSLKPDGSDAIGGFNVQVRPGLAFNLNENWSLVGKLNLFNYTNLKKDAYKYTETDFTIETALSFGVIYKF